jgi:serine/threonine protein kinase
MVMGGEDAKPTCRTEAMPSTEFTELPLELWRAIDAVCDSFEAAWMQGRRPAIEDHLGSVTDAGRPGLAAELIRIELEWRCRRGEPSSVQEYRTRFPACGESLDTWLAEAQAAADATAVAPLTSTDGPGGARTQTFGGGSPTAVAGPPRVLGEYELLAPLGAGGMGEVYRARHRRLGKLVALKVLPAGLRGSQERLARFLREVRAVGTLDHPNVVEAHDAGEQAGIVFLAMKLIDGVDLRRLVLQRGPLPPGEAAALAAQAARGLQYLHERGLVHRDVKPSNLMRTPDGVVKVLDLGLARWEGGEWTAPEELTVIGQPVGTPDYWAPEQARGAAADVRADLYGLGCTLFYLLTGRAPFAHHKGLPQKLQAQDREPPPDVRTLRPEVPAELAALLGRLLAKDPADRPPSAAAVADALTAIAAPPPAAAAPSPARKPRFSSGGVALAVGLATAALLLLLAWGLNKPRPPDTSLTAAPPTQPVPPADVQPAKPVRVLALDVTHFARQVGDPHGRIGRGSFDSRQGDTVEVEARLSRPAYAYLIAFRPDGKEEVCWPDDEDQPPPPAERPCYPPPKKTVQYGLDEGTGLQVFAVVVSPKPLPAYRRWRRQHGPPPWKPQPAAPGVVWRYDGDRWQPLMSEDGTRQRGKGREVPEKVSLVRLGEWLSQGPDVQAVAAVGFAVLPGGSGK